MFSLRVNRSIVRTWDVNVWFDPTKTAIGMLKFGSIQRRLRLVLNFDERQKRGKDARAMARVGGHAPPGERRKFPPFFLSLKLETLRSVNQTT